MKSILVLLALFFIFMSCRKQPAILSEKKRVTLIGKWNYSQSFYSTGGPLIYESTKKLKQWLSFESNGTFSSNMPDFKNAISYEKVDSIKVKFNFSSQQSGSRLFFFMIDTSANTLSLSPAYYICIEGCGFKFEK